MPLYEWRCSKCSFVEAHIAPVARCSDNRACAKCHGLAERIFSSFTAFKDFDAYSTKATGVVRTRGQEARSDKKRGRADVRDAKWFKSFKKEHKDQASLAPGKRKYTTLGAK